MPFMTIMGLFSIPASSSPTATATGRAYVCHSTIGAWTTSRIVEGIFLVNGMKHIIFSYGVSNYFIAQGFVSALGLKPSVLQTPLEISTPIGGVVVLK